MPSEERVDVLGMTEAEMVRDLYLRIAAGSSTVAEAKRLNAFGVPLLRRYSNGRVRAYGTKWHPSPIAGMIANTVYVGTHTLHSRYGAIDREVPPLVDADLWARANAQIQQNRRLPKGNATRTYLLRGIIRCGQCGGTYVGQRITDRTASGSSYYRCTGRTLTHYPNREHRCRAHVVNALWLEQEVWNDCRQFILHPGETMVEAQRQLQERIAQLRGMEHARSSTL
jgi:site-specific DNA recombinase